MIPPGLLPERVRTLLNKLLGDRGALATSNTWTQPQTFPAAGIVLGSVRVLAGSGAPNTAVTAPVGSLYLRSDGGANTSLYVKESGTGNTGWVAK